MNVFFHWVILNAKIYIKKHKNFVFCLWSELTFVSFKLHSTACSLYDAISIAIPHALNEKFQINIWGRKFNTDLPSQFVNCPLGFALSFFFLENRDPRFLLFFSPVKTSLEFHRILIMKILNWYSSFRTGKYLIRLLIGCFQSD